MPAGGSAWVLPWGKPPYFEINDESLQKTFHGCWLDGLYSVGKSRKFLTSRIVRHISETREKLNFLKEWLEPG